MKYYSVIINSSLNDIKAEELISFVKQQIQIDFKENIFSRMIVDEKEKNSIGISEVAGISSWVFQKSFEVKIVLIYSSEKMTEEAQNSILKIIEEPPENVLIILHTTNKDALLPTILSRCVLLNYKLEKTASDDWAKGLASEFIKADFIARSKLIDKISQDDEMTREKINTFLVEILRLLMNNREKIEILKDIRKIFRGIKRGGNIKLGLDYLSILIEDKYN